LVVCEGEKTEPQYIVGFQRHVRNMSVSVRIARKRGDPRRLVEIARAQDIHSKGHPEAFDEVWCVFDRDEHERFDEACTMARDNGYELAVSNPCVELWLLLHFRDSPGARHRDDLFKMLRDSHMPGYDKGLEFDDLVEGIDAASKRARRLDSDAESMEEPGRNPTTGFYRLIESISLLSR